MTARRPSLLGVLLCFGAGIAFAIQPVLGQFALEARRSRPPRLAVRSRLSSRRRHGGSAPALEGGIRLALGVVCAADSALLRGLGASAPFATLLHYAYLLAVVTSPPSSGASGPGRGVRRHRAAAGSRPVGGGAARRTRSGSRSRSARLSPMPPTSCCPTA
jgi:hypothetical protein